MSRRIAHPALLAVSLACVTSLSVTGCSSMGALFKKGDHRSMRSHTVGALVEAERVQSERQREKQAHHVSLSETQEPKAVPDAPFVTLHDIIQRYEGTLAVTRDPIIRAQIEQRLADLRLENAQWDEVVEPSATSVTDSLQRYERALIGYRDLMRQYPQHPRKADILYRLSQAADIVGQRDVAKNHLQQLVTDFPDSPWVTDAWYRLGDYAYTDRRYAEAEMSFREVLNQSAPDSLQQYAWYMLGWSLFKQSRYPEAQEAFMNGLDLFVERDHIREDLNFFEDNPTLSVGLEKASAHSKVTQKPKVSEILRDSFRVQSLIFDERGGVEALVEALAKRPENGPKRVYQHLLFERLATHFMEKKRYQDAAAVLLRHNEVFPDSPQAQRYQVRVIGWYEAEGFGELALEEKARFVKRYAPDTTYGKSTTEDNQRESQKLTRSYLLSLSHFFHSHAQRGMARIKDMPKGDRQAELQGQMAWSLREANMWYERFVALYPDDSETPQQYYLLGESYFALAQYRKAVTAYDMASQLPSSDALKSVNEDTAQEYQLASKSGYAAVVAFAAYIESLTPVKTDASSAGEQSERALIKARHEQIEHGLAFATRFPLHPEALKVHLQMAKELSTLGEYVEAKKEASNVLSDPRLVAAQQVAANGKKQNSQEGVAVEAWTVLRGALELRALCAFETSDYAQAEFDYQTLLSLPEIKGEPRATVRKTWSHQMAVSIFKQAEGAVNREAFDEAVVHFTRLTDLVPSDPLREQADYDRATYLMQLNRWPEAITVLRDFQHRFPRSDLLGTVVVKLASAYEATESWDEAAAYYMQMVKLESDPELRRVSHFRAAELWVKSGDRKRAVEAFKGYAHTYSRPFGPWIESQYQLSELYRALGQSDKRDFWLRHLIQAHDAAGEEQTARSRYLAASALTEFARRDGANYEAIVLTNPLTRSVKKKQKALTVAVKSWQAVSEYGVAPFATEAQFRIASLYQQLASALMNSERPKGLSDLEVEQYDLLLEEQAYPLEEQAIVLHENNLKNAWNAVYDEWVERSVKALAVIVPVRYKRQEQGIPFSEYHQ